MLFIGIFLIAWLSGLLILLLWDNRETALHGGASGILTGVWRGAERRSCPRIRATLSVRYEVVTPHGAGVGEGRQATSENLSAGGICLRLYERFNPRTTLQVEILPPHHVADPIRGIGEVRWTQEEKPTGSRRTFLSGLQFIHLSPADRDRLSQALKQTQRPTRT